MPVISTTHVHLLPPQSCLPQEMVKLDCLNSTKYLVLKAFFSTCTFSKRPRRQPSRVVFYWIL